MPRKAQVKNCHRCGHQHERKKSKYCSEDCAKVLTLETTKKLSDTRTKYLRENPDKHVWKRNTKFKSEPCERVKKYLTERNILFVEEWNPIETRAFAIDIAFPDIKLGIEVNGNQHYNRDGTLKEYYQERHDLIVESGWKLIEIHYSSCFNNEFLDKLISKWEQPDYSEYFNIKNSKKIKLKPESRDVKFQKMMMPKIEKVLESNIDFSKFGWVTKAAKILEVHPQKVHVYMKRYASEFYNQKCFKRKTAT